MQPEDGFRNSPYFSNKNVTEIIKRSNSRTRSLVGKKYIIFEVFLIWASAVVSNRFAQGGLMFNVPSPET